MVIDLTGKIALVCGASQGIGKATAIALSEAGANIILLARNEERLKSTLTELNVSRGQKHNYISADFSKPLELKVAVENFLTHLKSPVHILVNNTGGPAPGPANAAAIDDFTSAFQQHLICNHILMQAVLPGMKSSGYGRIINIISTSVKVPLPNLGVSNTIRAAVGNWSKTLANELAVFGITVNNVLPGATNTQRLQGIIKNKSEKTHRSVEEIEKEMLAEIPARRFATPQEVASAVVFLASPMAGYINGINIPVDGGRTGSI